MSRTFNSLHTDSYFSSTYTQPAPQAPKNYRASLHVIRSIHSEKIVNGPYADIIASRKKEFVDACQSTIPSLVNMLTTSSVTTPDWFDLRGIFRYVHPYDSSEKIRQQKELSYKARGMLLHGENPFNIAKKHSQAGSRQYGAIMPRHYISLDNETDRRLGKLKPGEISQVFRRDDGYWVYQILDTGNEGVQPFEEIPWPARRVLLRKVLGEHFSSSK